MGRGSEGGGCSLGGRPLTICARQGGVPGAGSLGGLLLCLGETGNGGVVGLLALQGGGPGPFLGQAGGNLGLLEVGRGRWVCKAWRCTAGGPARGRCTARGRRAR